MMEDTTMQVFRASNVDNVFSYREQVHARFCRCPSCLPIDVPSPGFVHRYPITARARE